MDKIKRYLISFPLGISQQSQQHDFIYPLIFQEYIYAFAHNRDFRSRPILLENKGSDKKSSLLIVKLLITIMYQQNPFIIYPNDFNQNPFLTRNKKLYYEIISDGFAFILEIPFSLRLISCLKSKKNNNIVKFNNLRSIHSIFPFLENNFSHLNFLLDILIPKKVHVEILVKTLHYWIKDAPYFHLLRFLLYWNSIITTNKASSFCPKNNQRFLLFLYNSYVCKYESIFLFLRNQSYHLRSTPFGVILQRIHFYVKIERLVNLFLKVKYFRTNLWLVKEPCLHYLRYQRKSIMASKGTSLFLNKWKCYVITFWQWHFSLWFYPRRIYINQLYNNSFEIFGYYSSFRMNPSLVLSQNLET